MANGMSDDDFPPFLYRMRFIIKDIRQRVAKDRAGFIKANAVLANI